MRLLNEVSRADDLSAVMRKITIVVVAVCLMFAYRNGITATTHNENEQTLITAEVKEKDDTSAISAPESKSGWEANPNDCDTATQWIAKESPHYCIDKERSVSPVLSSISGTKEDWLRASGIPQSEWWAVDYIVQRESSWNPNAVNPSSGACGLAQALPCSKIAHAGYTWNDPVDALKWQYSYVKARYGSYPQAVEFWKVNHWY